MSSNPVEAFTRLESAVDDVHEAFVNLWQCHENDVVDLTRRQHRVVARVQFLGLDLVTENHQRAVPERQAATSTPNWLSQLLQLSPREAKKRVRLAEALTNRYRATAEAFAAGEINEDQAEAIRSLADGLPAKATHEQKQLAEQFMLREAKTLDAEQLRACRKRMHDWIDPDGTLEDEKAAKDKRAAHFHNHGDGTQSFNWRDTDERMAKLKAALDPLAAPRPAENGDQDSRLPAQRRADAMADVVEAALRGDKLPKKRGNRAHLLVSVADNDLRHRTGFGTTTTGENLSGSALRRIACDAKITPIVVDHNGVPIAVGRTRRTVTPAQWCALVIRDRGCIFPGCDRPSGWCIAHHVVWWENWGLTDLDNLVLLFASTTTTRSTTTGGMSSGVRTGTRTCCRPPGSTPFERRDATTTGDHRRSNKGLSPGRNGVVGGRA